MSFDPNAPVTRYLERAFHTVDVTTGIVYGRNTGPDGIMQDLVLDLYEPARGHPRRPAGAAVRPRWLLHQRRSVQVSGLATELAKRGTSSPPSTTGSTRGSTSSPTTRRPSRPRCTMPRRRCAAVADAAQA
ncbi:MAG: hypothetical protein R2726_10185 [Acidimicrobiales bacterium]